MPGRPLEAALTKGRPSGPANLKKPLRGVWLNHIYNFEGTARCPGAAKSGNLPVITRGAGPFEGLVNSRPLLGRPALKPRRDDFVVCTYQFVRRAVGLSF